MKLPSIVGRLAGLAQFASDPGDSPTDRLANWAEKKFAPRWSRATVISQGSSPLFLHVARNGEGTTSDGHDHISIAPIAHSQIIGKPSATAGALMGAGAANPVVLAGALDTLGTITFGTAATVPTGGGTICHITFSTPFLTVPKVFPVWDSVMTATGFLGTSNVTVNGFDLVCGSGLAAGQAPTFYGTSWHATADPGGVTINDQLHVLEISSGQFLTIGKSRV
jgi:hypothetical protein